ncbi:hypothetical protein HYI43_02145 [Staphylococcus taiwanensis]|nr:hypothetical protein HYI43_02145 [Staphylococcus taiwanensis]
MTKFRDKMINRIIGTTTERDEREKEQIYTQFTSAFLITYFGLLVLAIVGVINDMFVRQVTIPTIGIFLLFFIANVSLLIGIRKHNLDKDYVYSQKEYQILLRKHKMSCIFAGIMFGVMTTIFNLMGLYFSHQPIDIGFLILNVSFSTIVFGVLSYFFGKRKIIKEYGEGD